MLRVSVSTLGSDFDCEIETKEISPLHSVIRERIFHDTFL